MSILKKNSNILLVLNQFIDIFIIAIAFWAAFLTRNLKLGPSDPHLLVFFISIICCHVSFRLAGMYESFRKQTFPQIFTKIIQASLTGITGVVFITYLLHMDAVSRLLLSYFIAYMILFFTISKATLYYTLLRTRNQNYNTRKILIIGSRARALELISEITNNPGSGYRIHGCLETNEMKELVGNTVGDDVTIVGTMDDFKQLLLDEVIDEILFALPLKKIHNVNEYIFFAESVGINVRILPDFQIHQIMYYPETAKIFIDSFLSIPTMSISSTPYRNSDLIIKSIIDYSIAAIGAVIMTPLLLLIALTIKISSRGPVFFRQTRSGINGRNFTLYKFRTMVDNAEKLQAALGSTNEMDGPVFKIENDPRITSIGKFLRKTSLDELPQLFNVLKGEMSLVGPRPPLPAEVEKYQHWQRRKLSMKPGLTCIWQVSGRNDISFEEWMKMDLEYIDNWSLILDMKLLGLTAREVFLGGGH